MAATSANTPSAFPVIKPASLHIAQSTGKMEDAQAVSKDTP